jgi:starch phosphorylase
MTRSETLYKDRYSFAKTSLINTAAAGIFSADRAVKQYASEIWGLLP